MYRLASMPIHSGVTTNFQMTAARHQAEADRDEPVGEPAKEVPVERSDA